jgi:DNA polymerase I-like protein with 3'-5' exonuclease and polymerase domains
MGAYKMKDTSIGFTFGEVSVQNVKKSENFEKISSIIITTKDVGSSKQLVILVDQVYKKQYIIALETLIQKMFPHTSYIIMYSVTHKPYKIKNIYRFYSKHAVVLSEYIPKTFSNYVVITIGNSLQALTKTPSLQYRYFYDIVFNDPMLFVPQVGYTFPLPYLTEMFKEAQGFVHPAKNMAFHYAQHVLSFVSKQPEIVYSSHITIPRLKKYTITTQEELDAFYTKYQDYTEECAVDIETTSLDPHTGEIICITVSPELGVGYFIPFPVITDKDRFAQFFSNKKIIGHNFKFDYRYLHYYKTPVPVPFADTFKLAQTLNEFRANDLKAMSFIYTKFGGYNDALEEYKEKYKIKNYGLIPFPILKEYAVMDAIVTLIIYKKMIAHIKELDKKYPPSIKNGWTIEQSFFKIIMPIYQDYCEIEVEGIYVDEKELKLFQESIDKDIAELTEAVKAELGIKNPYLNVLSTKQLGEYIASIGWKGMEISKTGVIKTNDAQLIEWEKEGKKAASLLRKLRTAVTIRNMIIGKEVKVKNAKKTTGWLPYIFKEPDGSYRMYPLFGVANARSKRNTCKNPNVQQIPSHSKYGKAIKKLITLPDAHIVGRENSEYLFATLDYKSLQIRLCALDSLDPFLCKLYKEDTNADLHSVTGFSLIDNVLFDFYTINGTITLISEQKEIQTKTGVISASSIQVGDTLIIRDKEIAVQSIIKDTRRLHDVKEFVLFKEYGAIADARQLAKQANFSLLFGASANTFAKRTLKTIWTIQQAENFVSLQNLENEVNAIQEKYASKNKAISYEDAVFLACATFIRNKFFNNYKGLQERIKRNIEIAETQGYLRTYHGIIRRLPELLLQGEDDDQKIISNAKNIAANSPIQSLEVAKITQAIHTLREYIKKNSMTTKIFNSVHDSVDMYLYKKEIPQLVPMIYTIFQRMEEWQNEVPLDIDMAIGSVYKSGEDALDYMEKMKEEHE